MPFSFHSICSTNDDYTCNEQIVTAPSALKLWENQLAKYKSPDEKKKFIKCCIITPAG